jgi:hypothetical protein
VVDTDKRRAILARRAEGQTLREIVRGVGVSLAVVHSEVRAAEALPLPPQPDDRPGRPRRERPLPLWQYTEAAASPQAKT